MINTPAILNSSRKSDPASGHLRSSYTTKYLALLASLLLTSTLAFAQSATEKVESFSLDGTGAGQITSLSATTLERSGYLEIFGSNFGSTGQVLINGIAAPTANWQGTRIIAYVPESIPLAMVPVLVVNASGQPSNSVNLTVTARQASGHVNWRFRMNGPYSSVRPVIAGDGTVYVIDVFDHLYALTSDGGLKWLVQGAGDKGVAVGADGSVYVASEDAIRAFNSNGSAKWTFVQTPRAFICLGVSVGPDGNIYSVGTEGMGVFSLTPAGALRWTNPEPYDRLIVDYAEIVFGPNGSNQQLYFDANNHLRAVGLNGNSVFALPGTYGQPAVAPNGSLHGAFSAFSPSGGLVWTFASQYPYNVQSPPDIGADGTHYFVQNTIQLFALNSNGSQRWHFTLADGVTGAVVNPQNTQLLLGSSTTLNNPGYLIAASAQDGHELWRVTLPAEEGFNQGTDTRARFAPNGSAAYIITHTATGDNDTSRSFVYSLNTGGGVIPAPTSVVSRKTHGSAGAFDIDLPPTGNAGIECRGGGVTNDYQVVYTFPIAVTLSGAVIAPEAGKAASMVGSPGISPDGRTVTLNLTNVTDVQTITMTLSSVNNGTNTADVTARMSLLVGDTNGTAVVNASDVSQTKSRSGQPVTSTNFRSDVAVNGTINASDLALLKSRSGDFLLAMPPPGNNLNPR